MWFELGLLGAVALCGWIALDGITAAGRRKEQLPVATLATCAGLWAAGELISSTATDPGRQLDGLRLLYAGSCFIGVAWLWFAAQAAHAEWWRRAPWLVAVAALPPAAIYATLLTDAHPRWFSDWSTWPPERGPLFFVLLAYNWLLMGLGFRHLFRAVRRLRASGSVLLAALGIALALPLLGNALYLLGAFGPTDPSSLLLGVTALVVRVAVIDTGLAAHMPMARGDVLDQLEVGVLVADLDEVVVAANPAAHHFLGEARLVRRSLPALLTKAEEHSDRVLEVRRFPIRSAVAQIGHGAVLSDRTESTRAARRLQLAARLEAVGSLTAGIAHEVNNPLAFVRSNLSRLEKLARGLEGAGEQLPATLRELAAEAPEVVGESQEGVERIARLVERLRSFARHDTVGEPFQELAPARVVERAVAMAGAGLPKSAIRVQAHPVPFVRGVEPQLVQILLNLLINAIQAAPEEPRIEVETRARDGGVEVAVRDRGPGIREEDLPHLFEPFFTTKPPGQGTGLGLSLSRDLAIQHGGRLEATSHPGGGAVFRLWLPAAEGASPAG